MKKPAKDKTAPAPKAENELLRTLKHDINNQLSNIFLALEQLRYEVPDATEDCIFYLDSIGMSATKINSLLKETDGE